MNKFLFDYYRCPADYADYHLNGILSQDHGYFRWGEDTVIYGRCVNGFRAASAEASLYDVAPDISQEDTKVLLPFDPDEITTNLLRERYSEYFREEGRMMSTVVRKAYYTLRPLLSVSMRKHLQRLRLRKWRSIPFPEWPVDCTIDRLQRRLLSVAMKAHGVDRLPFIWFWPEGYTSCAIVTHDVEQSGGRDLCGALMDVDESFGFRCSFQVVPEHRYSVPENFLSSIKERGCEINVHDLRHDGYLYVNHVEFLRRAELINKYVRDFGACGFRSAVLYRNADWYSAYEFLYDSSIPNVAHLDPQPGGCCTVMPYFIGKIIELPVTCTQDYSLFHILGDYSIELWKRQIEIITANHGLVNVLVHPDYVMERRALPIYKSLLAHLAELREEQGIWTPLPKEAAVWWQRRNRMRLEQRNGNWVVEGQGSAQACVAYACLSDDGVVYEVMKKNTQVLC